MMLQKSAANPPNNDLVSGEGRVRVLRLRGFGAMSELARLQSIVESDGACSLPGSSIKYDTFLPVLRRAQSRGYVKDHEGEYVALGLRNGFDLGIDVERVKLKGKRIFKNYKTAYDNHASVSRAVQARVDSFKTVNLGSAKAGLAELCEAHASLAVFPMGAVLKPNQPEGTPVEELVWRPTDDHTKTGINEATVMGILGHSLNTYKEVAWFLQQGYFMRVSDVKNAFLLLPLHPKIWLFMLFRWSLGGPKEEENLLFHIFGDFGTRGMPGTFQLFLVRVVVQMARSELIITLPLTVYVDDAANFAQSGWQADAEMERLQVWSWDICGVPWNAPKDRPAAIPQYYIGFWWDSVERTRSLDEVKLAKYLKLLLAASEAPKLDLVSRQSLAGKVQRAILTMPPGAACLLVNCYAMMSTLTLPWHSKRTTRAERDDYRFIHDCLLYIDGRGYYSYDGFPVGPCVLSDASKSRALTAGGYVESTGFYDWWTYGASAARKPIDFLEGDTVLQACRDRGALWRGCLVPFGIDNQSFERSALKGRSVAPRLNTLLKELFVCQIRDGFILAPWWISSEDNFLADHLSRNREEAFLLALPAAKFLVVPFDEVRRHPEAGRKRCLPHDADPGMAALRQLLAGFSSNTMRDGPSRGAGVGGDAQLL